MGSISYNDSKINRFVQEVNSIAKVLDELNIDCKGSVEMIVNARGFNEYISSVDNNCFDPYFEECSFSIKGIAETVRFMQSEILLFNDDKDSIKFFLNSLSEEEILNSSDALKEVYSKMVKETSNFFERTGATIFTSAISAVEGILDLGETLIDLGDIVLTGAKSIFASCFDLATGKFNSEDSSVKMMFEDCKARVSKKAVESIFDSFYDNNEFGRSLKDKSYFFDQTRNISKGIVQSMGIVGVGVFTGGAGLAAGGLSAGRLATVAGTIAMSTNTEDAWANGASVGDGLKRGLVGAVWDGAQWFVGAKIGAPGGYGDKFAQNVFKSTSKGAVAAARIGLDAVDSGLEGFVQPLLDLMYKDSYINDNGETVKFDASMTFADKYREAFDDAGGMSNVLVQSAIGAGGSAIGEISDMTQLLKAEGESKLDLDAGAKTAAGATGLSLIDRVKNIFKSDVDAKTKASTDIDVSLRNADASSNRLDISADSRVAVDTDITTKYGNDVFDSDISSKKTDMSIERLGGDSDISLRGVESESSLRNISDDVSVGEFNSADFDVVKRFNEVDSQVRNAAVDSSDDVFALSFRDSAGNEISAKTAGVDDLLVSNNAMEIKKPNHVLFPKDLSPQESFDVSKCATFVVDDFNANGALSTEHVKEILSFSPKTVCTYFDVVLNNENYNASIGQILNLASPEQTLAIINRVLPTGSSMAVINSLSPTQMSSCMVSFLGDNAKFNDFTCRLSDAQLGRALDNLAEVGTFDSKRSLKKILSLTGATKTQRLIDFGYAKNSMVSKMKPTSFFSNKVDINETYSRIVADLDSMGAISTKTKEYIGQMNPKQTAAIIESSFGLNNPRCSLDVINSIEYGKLSDVYTELMDSPYQQMFVDRLSGRQVHSIVSDLSSRNITCHSLVQKISDVQADACLKRMLSASTYSKGAIDNVEIFLSRLDSSQIDNYINRGYLDNYFDCLDKKGLGSSVLKKYAIYDKRNFDKRSLVSSSNVKAYNDLELYYQNNRNSRFNRQKMVDMFEKTDSKALTAFLKNYSGSDTDVNCIVDFMPHRKLQESFGAFLKSSPGEAVDFIKRMDPKKYGVFTEKLCAYGKGDFYTVNTFVKQIDEASLNGLVESGCFDNFVNGLRQEQIEKSALKGYIYDVFSDSYEGVYKKHVVLSRQQVRYLSALDAELKASISAGKFTQNFQNYLKNADTNTIIKLLDVSRKYTEFKNMPSQVFNQISYARVSEISNRLIELDIQAAKNIFGGTGDSKLSSLMHDLFNERSKIESEMTMYKLNTPFGRKPDVSSFESRINAVTNKINFIVSSMSSDKLDKLIKFEGPGSKYAAMLQKSGDIANFRKYASVAKDAETLNNWINTCSDAELSKTLNYLSASRLTDGKTTAAKILKGVPSERIDNLINSGNLRYNDLYATEVKSKLITRSTNSKMSFFDSVSSTTNGFGVDQAVSEKLVTYRVKEPFIDDIPAFRDYLVKEKGYDIESAVIFTTRIESAQVINHRDFLTVKDYLVTSGGYSPERLMEINRTCFEKRMSSTYDSLYRNLAQRTDSAVDARRIIDCINSTGTCSYADVANIIVDSYKNNPDSFERDFGFSLFIDDGNGNRIINSTELMTDMYINFNSNQFGGSLFTIDNSGKISINGDSINTKNQTYLSTGYGYKVELINKYLKSKNKDLTFGTTFVMHSTYDFVGDSTPALTAERIKQNIVSFYNSKPDSHISLGVYTRNCREFRFMQKTADGFKTYVSSLNWNEGGGHAIYVTGIEGDYVMVSSWGKKLYIPLSDFENNIYDISYSSIGGIK